MDFKYFRQKQRSSAHDTRPKMLSVPYNKLKNTTQRQMTYVTGPVMRTLQQPSARPDRRVSSSTRLALLDPKNLN